MQMEVSPMPDVPERCPMCGVVCLHHQLAAARAEAERLRKQYEALRSGVERVVQDLHERAHATARDWKQSGHPYHDGESDAYYLAEEMVSRLLAEAGGGDQ